jgi:hypothetical protein
VDWEPQFFTFLTVTEFTRPKGDIVAVSHPAWWTEIAAAKNGMVQLLHPDRNWLTFCFPPECANRLGLALVKQAAPVDYFAGSLPPSTGHRELTIGVFQGSE